MRTSVRTIKFNTISTFMSVNEGICVHVPVLEHYLMTYLVLAGLYPGLVMWLLPQCSQCAVYFVMGGALCY